MSEDKQEPTKQGSEPEKKPQSQPPPPAAATPKPPVGLPRPPAAAPRPAPTLPPSRPPVQSDAKKGRRTFLKAMVTIGALLSVVPFVPWGEYLSSSVTSSSSTTKKWKIILDNDSKSNGGQAGSPVNVNDLTSFPSDESWLFTYPSSGNSTQDAQNPDTFVKFGLIRLPEALGGSAADASAFIAFSKVCVHLWCSPSYNPAQGHEQYECPCHGSIYRVPDGLSIGGPASLQPFPTNAIPMLTLSADSDGYLYVEPPVWDVEHNGIVGYGRDYKSYDSYILPAAQEQA
jgi:rieske iron-sulfur protein